MQRAIRLSVYVTAFLVLKTRALLLHAEFSEALHHTSRLHHVRINSDVQFPCFVSKISSNSTILKLSAFLRKAVWKGPTGNIIFPVNLENSRIIIDSMKTLTIIVAGVKDSGMYKCIINLDENTQISHEIKLVVYAVPEVGLETPFVFEIIGNCMQSVHRMNDLVENIFDHLCGEFNPVTKRRRSCQYSISLSCRPFHTYRSIMLGVDEQIQWMELNNLSKVVEESRLFKTTKRVFRIPLVTTKSRSRKHVVNLKIKRDQEFMDMEGNLSDAPMDITDYLNQSLIGHTSDDWTEWKNKNSFRNISDSINGGKFWNSTKINTEKVIDADNDEEEMIKLNRERLLSILKNVIVVDDGSDAIESIHNSTSSKYSEHDDHESDDIVPDVTLDDSDIPETTPFLSEEVKELLKLNEIFKKENTHQVAILYLLKTPHPRFNPPACSDDCVLNLKFFHITWHINVILDLVRFITSSSKLPNTATLLGETVAKGRAFVFCLPGFFLQRNSCIPCPPGLFNSVGIRRGCDPCPENSYQDQYGSKVCYPCPKGTETNKERGVIKSNDCIGIKSVKNDLRNLILLILKLLAYFLLAALCFIIFYMSIKAIFRIDQSRLSIWRKFEGMRRRHDDEFYSSSRVKKPGLKPKRRPNLLP